MQRSTYLLLPFLFMGSFHPSAGQGIAVYASENLEVRKVAEQAYQHISYLQTQDFGKVACNGMVVVDKGEALVFDTPATSQATRELIKWVQEQLRCKIKAVVPTHFHADCVAGLDEFHQLQVPSYASRRTIELAKARQSPLPQRGFEKRLELKVGTKKAVIHHPGEGHTKDNVVAYFPTSKVLFGGCLIKETGAGKGNLEDANTAAWSQSVSQLKATYPEIKVVIPGHGKTGGTELLDYTIGLFRPE